MRPLESVLLAVVFAALSGLWARPRAPINLRMWIVAGIITVLALQIALEQGRWQMVPAYILALACAAAWLTPPAGPRHLRIWIMLGLGEAAFLVAMALPLAFPVFDLARPHGPYGVGTTAFHWTDTARADPFDPSRRRELMVQLWYPAAHGARGPRSPYVEDPAALGPLARLLHLPPFVFSHLSLIRTNAIVNAPPAPGGSWPVLLFAHGRGGFRQHDTALVEALVSQGYVVAAMDQPFAASGVRFPDGRMVPIDPRMQTRSFEDRMIPRLAEDASFTLDRLASLNAGDAGNPLTSRLDMGRVGMFGLSLGGAVTAQACLREARIRACLPIDVFMPADVIREGLARPVLLVTRDAATMRREGWREGDVAETQSTMRETFLADRAPAWMLVVPGMYHQDFSDFPYLAAPMLERALNLSGTVDRDRGRRILAAYAQAFFDHELQGLPAPLLEGASKDFPEVRVEGRP